MMMQRDVKSAEEQAYINKVLGTDTGMNMFNIPQAIAGLPSIFG